MSYSLRNYIFVIISSDSLKELCDVGGWEGWGWGVYSILESPLLLGTWIQRFYLPRQNLFLLRISNMDLVFFKGIAAFPAEIKC